MEEEIGLLWRVVAGGKEKDKKRKEKKKRKRLIPGGVDILVTISGEDSPSRQMDKKTRVAAALLFFDSCC